MLPQKGIHPYAVNRLCQDLSKIFGYTSFILKSDQEPAILALKKAVQTQLQLEGAKIDQIMMEESPVGESGSNGEVENAIKECTGQFRTLKCKLEDNYGFRLLASHAAMPWLVRYAAETIFRHKVGQDGKTARERLRGRKFKRELVEFGECVWYLKPKSKGKEKFETRWGTGVWLGIREESGEIFIGTAAGVLKVRSVRRKSSPEEKWNAELFKSLVGVPWEPVPGRAGIEVKSKLETPVENTAGLELPLTAERAFKVRRLQLHKADFDTHGYSPNCTGCAAIIAGKDPQNHKEHCRKRITAKLEEVGDDRCMRQLNREEQAILAESGNPVITEIPEPETVVSEELLPDFIGDEIMGKT